MSAFIGAGIVSIAPWDNTTLHDARTFVDVGNVSALTMAVAETRQELRNYRTAAGGTYASVARVDSVTLSLDFRDFSAANLALALWGTATVVTDTTTVEALIKSAPLVAIKFDGINIVDGKDFDGKYYKGRLGAPQNIGLIGDDFGTMQISITLEADETIVGAGKSQYFALLLKA